MEQTSSWLVALRRYLLATIIGHFIWELLQLPLYTIWHEANTGELAYAIIHCTGGDFLIATEALIVALAVTGMGSWPRERFGRVAVLTVLLGVTYTMFSEWLNVEVRRSWGYTELMPRLPVIGTGVAPLMQWFVVPAVALWWSRRPIAKAQLSH